MRGPMSLRTNRTKSQLGHRQQHSSIQSDAKHESEPEEGVTDSVLICELMQIMAGTGSSMVYSLLLFVIILSLQEMYRGKLASSELFTILGGFTSSLLFLVLLTFIGNFQEASGARTGWGAVLLSEGVALIAASTVHRFPVLRWLIVRS
ncbi:hypothetical protein QQ045_012938 [Rhodiola kirilowii]